MALLRSYSPPSILRVSAALTSCWSSPSARSRSALDVLARARPFDEHGQIVAAPLQRFAQLDVLFDPALALHHLLRLVLVVPEAGRRYALRELRQLLIESSPLKDASAVHPHVRGGPRTVESRSSRSTATLSS